MQNIQNKTYLVSKTFNLGLRRIYAALLPTSAPSSSSPVSTFPAVRGTAAGAAGCFVAMVSPPPAVQSACCWGRPLLVRFAGSKRVILPLSSRRYYRQSIVASHHKISSAKFRVCVGLDIAFNSSTFHLAMSRGSTWQEPGAVAGAASSWAAAADRNTLRSMMISI